jgi:hypothetical protein
LRWPTLSVIDVNQEPESRELHLEHLFIEHELRHFATQAVTEGNKKPDFYSPPQRHTTMLSFPEKIYACWRSRPPVKIAGAKY